MNKIKTKHPLKYNRSNVRVLGGASPLSSFFPFVIPYSLVLNNTNFSPELPRVFHYWRTVYHYPENFFVPA